MKGQKMENQEIKKLPFWDTVARSFKYVLKNRALLVGILPVIAALSVSARWSL